MNEWIKASQIDRDDLVELHRRQNLSAMHSLVELGELTQREAEKVHEAFMTSDVLQKLVAIDMATVEAMLKGQVH